MGSSTFTVGNLISASVLHFEWLIYSCILLKFALFARQKYPTIDRLLLPFASSEEQNSARNFARTSAVHSGTYSVEVWIKKLRRDCCSLSLKCFVARLQELIMCMVIPMKIPFVKKLRPD